MAWRRPGDKPLSEAMLVCSTDTYMHHLASNELNSTLLAFCEGNHHRLVWFPAQRASNVENLSMPWFHHNSVQTAMMLLSRYWPINRVFLFSTMRLRQFGHYSADNIFKYIFLNKNLHILIQISLKVVRMVPINNKPGLIRIMTWHPTGHKPLSEPMMDQFTDVLICHLASMS